jgi:succinate dehydrogenase/fumarate reductase flavoprotein subunit
MACVPHNYLLGALTYGKLCAQHALDYVANVSNDAGEGERDQIERERMRVLAPLEKKHGIPHHQYEYKVRRLVNDYLQPPKSENRLRAGLAHFQHALEELAEIGAETPHDLMRVAEGGFIRDCAEMAARASMFRTESRWGLYHYRQDYPEMDDDNWFVHVNLKQNERGEMELFTRPVAPYVVPLDRSELRGYHGLRIQQAPQPAANSAA